MVVKKVYFTYSGPKELRSINTRRIFQIGKINSGEPHFEFGEYEVKMLCVVMQV